MAPRLSDLSDEILDNLNDDEFQHLVDHEDRCKESEELFNLTLEYAEIDAEIGEASVH